MEESCSLHYTFRILALCPTTHVIWRSADTSIPPKLVEKQSIREAPLYVRQNQQNRYIDTSLSLHQPHSTQRFRAQWGLPSAHELLELRKAKTLALEKEDFHRFWWLERNLAEEFPYLLIKDPRVVHGKGRPRRGGPFTRLAVAISAPPSSALAALGTASPPKQYKSSTKASGQPSGYGEGHSHAELVCQGLVQPE